MVQEFTVSELLAQVHSSLNGRYTEEEVIRVWRTVGRLLESQLLNGRGLRIEKFATIAVTDARTLDVQCSPDFLQQAGVRPVAVPTRGTISAGKLNMVQLAQTTGLEKSDVARIMDRIIAVLGKVCLAGAAVKLTLLPVLQIEIKDKRLGYHVLPEFNSRLQRAGQANRRLLQQQQKEKVARAERANSDASLSIFTADLPGTPSLMHSPRSRASTPSERWAKPVRPRPSSARSNFDPRGQAAAAVDDGTIVQRVKDKILARAGVQGIRGISRLLRIMDDNRDGKLSRSELKYGLADFGIDASNIELDQLMRHYDKDKNGSIDLNELLVGLRGELSERRVRVLKRAFAVLDKDADKQISLREIRRVYDARQHPDVQAGRMTEEQALRNFMSQWDRHDKNDVITLDDFLEYYRDISAAIDDDEYFEAMVGNAWRLNAPITQDALSIPASELRDDALSVQSSSFGMHVHDPSQRQRSSSSSRTKRQVDEESAVSRASMTGEHWSGRYPSSTRDAQHAISPAVEAASAPCHKLRELLYSPPCSLEGLMNRLRVSLISERPSLSLAGFTTQLQRLDPALTSSQLRALAHAADVLGVGSVDLSELHKMFVEKFGRDRTTLQTGNVVERVRAKILQRAGHAGFSALKRILKIMDASGDNRLSKEELKYGLADYGIHLNLLELDGVFSYFDRNRDGQVDISEFLRGVRGDMNARRRQLVLQVFDILDRDKNGSITVDEIRDRYDVTTMPEVKAGFMTPEQALKQFLAQWERGNGDGVVTRDEFIDYYTDLSALIDGDDYFELMVRNAWHIAGGSGWAENTANRRVLVTHPDGRQRVEVIHNDLGLKATDKTRMRAELSRQGVKSTNIQCYGGDDERRNRERQEAAVKFQAAFRGHKAREHAERVIRKKNAEELRKAEEEKAHARAQKKTVYRPKLRSAYGF